MRCCAISCITSSIHALLAESDVFSFCFSVFDFLFLSTLSLRRATRGQRPSWGGCLFLSTLSLRRATLFALLRDLLHHEFYPRSPCGERRFQFLLLRFRFFISIHALLAESDCPFLTFETCVLKFLSTLSLRRATAGKRTQQPNNQISIHALLAESDVHN